MANQETTQVIMLAVLYTKQDFDYQLEAVRGPPCQVMLLCTCQLLGQCGWEALCVGAHQEVRRVHFPGCPGQLQQELGARSAEKVVEVFWIWLLIVCQWYPDITIAGVRSVLWLWQSASWTCLVPCTPPPLRGEAEPVPRSTTLPFHSTLIPLPQVFASFYTEQFLSVFAITLSSAVTCRGATDWRRRRPAGGWVSSWLIFLSLNTTITLVLRRVPLKRQCRELSWTRSG